MVNPMHVGELTEKEHYHILVVEDNEAHIELARRSFSQVSGTYRLTCVTTLEEARSVIRTDPPDLVIADWLLPSGRGTDLLSDNRGHITVPLVVMTSHGSEALAVDVMKAGALDYVPKSEAMFKDLPHIARHAIGEWESIQGRKAAVKEIEKIREFYGGLVDFLPDATLAIDMEGRIIVWNRAIEEMTGIPAEEMLGKDNCEYSIPFYGKRRPILVDLVLRPDMLVEQEYRFLKREGEKNISEAYIPSLYGGRGGYLWGTATPLHDSSGTHYRCLRGHPRYLGKEKNGRRPQR